MIISTAIFFFLIGNAVLICYLVARILFTVLDRSMAGKVVLPGVGNRVVSLMSFQEEENIKVVGYLKKYGLSFVLTLTVGLIARHEPLISCILLTSALVLSAILPERYAKLINSSWNSTILIIFIINSGLFTIASLVKTFG